MSAVPVRLEAVHMAITIARPSPRVVLVTITGQDTGELGDAPFREIEKHLGGAERPEIFVDARGSLGASVDVSAAWASWLMNNKTRYARLSILTGSRFIELTASFVQRFTGLGERMRIYTEPGAFDAALRDLDART
jgi:hypothetical protein